jgi:hypothetical protein
LAIADFRAGFDFGFWIWIYIKVVTLPEIASKKTKNPKSK